MLEVQLREKLGDSAGVRAPLERLLWISPYDVDLHVKLAELASRAGDHKTALRERRAIVALNPPDPIEARYQLAKELAAAGDARGGTARAARRAGAGAVVREGPDAAARAAGARRGSSSP